MKRHVLAGSLGLCTLAFAACNDVDTSAVATALTTYGSYNTEGQPNQERPPAGTALNARIDTNRSGILPLEVGPAQTMYVSVWWTAGAITYVNATFGNGYFAMQVPRNQQMLNDGLFQYSISLHPKTCMALEKKCYKAKHQVQLRREDDSTTDLYGFPFTLNCSAQPSCTEDAQAGIATMDLALTPSMDANVSVTKFQTSAAVSRFLESTSTTVYASDRDPLSTESPCRSAQLVLFSNIEQPGKKSLVYGGTDGFLLFGERAVCSDMMTEKRWISTAGSIVIGANNQGRVYTDLRDVVLTAVEGTTAMGTIGLVGTSLIGLPNAIPVMNDLAGTVTVDMSAP